MHRTADYRSSRFVHIDYISFIGSLFSLVLSVTSLSFEHPADPCFSLFCYIGIVYQLPGVFSGERANGLTSHLKAMGLLDSARIVLVTLLQSLGFEFSSDESPQFMARQYISSLSAGVDHRCRYMALKHLHRNERWFNFSGPHTVGSVFSELDILRCCPLWQKSSVSCNHIYLPGYRFCHHGPCPPQSHHWNGCRPLHYFPSLFLHIFNQGHLWFRGSANPHKCTA